MHIITFIHTYIHRDDRDSGINFAVVGNSYSSTDNRLLRSGCSPFLDASHTPNNNLGADNMAWVYSHEVFETITNPQGRVG